MSTQGKYHNGDDRGSVASPRTMLVSIIKETGPKIGTLPRSGEGMGLASVAVRSLAALLLLLGLSFAWACSAVGVAAHDPYPVSHCDWRTGSGCPSPPTHCSLRGPAQDPACTPGALNTTRSKLGTSERSGSASSRTE
jgi:hypothetical protein